MSNKLILEKQVVVLDRKVLNLDSTGKSCKIDESKSADDVESISIDSQFIDVNISVSDSQDTVSARLYGQAYIDEDFNFDFSVVNQELKIALNFTKAIYDGYLKLDVTVPKKTFKNISINSESSNVTLSENVLTESLNFKSNSGNFETAATFSFSSITTNSGNADVFVKATSDISLSVRTISGNILTRCNHVKYSKLTAISTFGDVHNHSDGECGYNANVSLSSVYGDIRIL